MNLHEFQSKQLFSAYNIPIPAGEVTDSPTHAQEIAQQLGGKRWLVKAQIHAGGRGKVGGVRMADSLDQVAQHTQQLIGSYLATHQSVAEGLPVNQVLVEAATTIQHEYYLSLLLDRNSQRIQLVVSASGGMDIEAVAEETPDKIITCIVHPITSLQAYQCRKLAFSLGLQGSAIRAMTQLMINLYQLFLDHDATQIEINPLVTTDTGDLLALDAKINIDDNALYAHPKLEAMRDSTQEDEKEHSARLHDLNYITLDGEIGCMVNGAGLAMATMDLVKLKGGRPANFLDVGGNATADRVAEAFKLILSDHQVKVILVNIFGGIVRCDVIAAGIIQAVERVHVSIPVIVRLEGTHAEAGRKLLAESDLALIAAENLTQAAEQAVELSRKPDNNH